MTATTARAARIDLGKFTSEATQAKAEAQERLDRAIESTRAAATGQAQKLNRAELYTEIAKIFPQAADGLSPKSAKDLLTVVYVDARIAHSDAGVERRKLDTPAFCDRQMAELINQMLDAADQADATVRKLAGDHSGKLMAVRMSWDLGPAMVAQYAAMQAEPVAAAVTNGHEIRGAVSAITRREFSRLMGFPGQVASNGVGGMNRMEDLAEAQAAAVFIKNVAKAYQADATMQVPIETLGW